jgi:hypothetical protein
MPQIDPPFQSDPQPRNKEQKDDERTFIGGPTLFTNRFFVQTYNNGAVRITFGEQYSPDLTVMPVWRSSIYLIREDAKNLRDVLIGILGDGEPQDTSEKVS